MNNLAHLSASSNRAKEIDSDSESDAPFQISAQQQSSSEENFENFENAESKTICFHCYEDVPRYSNLFAEVNGQQQPMCCMGCKSSAEFIVARGLQRFYEHRSHLSQQEFFGQIAPSTDSEHAAGRSKWQFLDDPQTQPNYVTTDTLGKRRIRVHVDGLYCRSCGWLIERALQGVSSTCVVQMDTAAHSMHLVLDNSSIKLSSLLATIEHLGYRPKVPTLGELHEGGEGQNREYQSTIRRIAVAGFGMMQVMTYAVASYLGAASSAPMSSPIERFLLLISMLVATVVVFYSGRPFFTNALNDLRNRHLGMDIPIALAIGAAYFPSVVVLLFDLQAEVYFDSAVMFVFFILLGRFVESRARHKLSGTRDNVESLLPRAVGVKRKLREGETILEVSPREIMVGDKASFSTGSIVAFDSKIVAGEGQIDEALVTGESEPRNLVTGAHIYAGSKLISGSITAVAISDWDFSSIAKIQSSIQDAQCLENNERAIGYIFSRYFIGFVLLLTIVVALAWMLIAPERVFEITLAMLIAACPCAFSLAAPLGRAAAINSLKKVGVLLTSNRALDKMKQASLWCFDKTGTLTRGSPTISKVVVLAKAPELQCLEYIAAVEQHSSHVLALAFKGMKTRYVASNVFEALGQGISAKVNNETLYVGKPSWVLEAAGMVTNSSSDATGSKESLNQLIRKYVAANASEGFPQMMLAKEGQPLALIYFQDELRSSSAAFIRALKSKNLRVAMLSGDNRENANKVARELGISECYSELLPQQKVNWVQSQPKHSSIVMVGDGINDAPVLAAADVAVALGSGSDLAMQNADAILLNGRLDKLANVPIIADRQKLITRQNMIWALLYNLLALPLAAAGFLTPWIAALGMSLSSLVVVFNAARIRVD